ncbi:patatin-like phospholipase family protein [Tabrizicola sp. KVB23]|uniref:Patatin-like phospholipase family protein n=1 Tax=Fuscibacter oryzae TaxID=2803939 RepID=A0A8J7STH0_9RHOB|nr:patatin-like phospholipase family protein [Fuscibacter oryzae]
MMRRISLALQGGGAHGAFTWGVLDRLLEEPDIEVAAISGTSAGALNAAALKAGLIEGGNAGARASLARLWSDVAEVGDMRLVPWMKAFLPYATAMADFTASALPISIAGIAAQFVTPYAWGAAYENPLRPVVERLDFSKVCNTDGPQIAIGATNVRTGRIRIFAGQEVTPEALLASACLPTVFQAVQIGGEHYWDGGFTGNPALFPLYEPGLPDDVVLVSINPFDRSGLPMTPLEIEDRVSEISFNAALLGELRAIAFVRRLIGRGQVEPGQMKDVRLHLISDETLMQELSAGSKLIAGPRLIERLHQAGRQAAGRFVSGHGDKIGVEASFDVEKLFR